MLLNKFLQFITLPIFRKTLALDHTLSQLNPLRIFTLFKLRTLTLLTV